MIDMISLKSKLTQKLLSYIFLQNQEFYASALARRLELDRGNLIRKLNELEKIGLLVSEVRGNEKYYKINIKFPLLKDYKRIIEKTCGFGNRLKNALEKLKGIESAYLFGSYVRDKMDASSDVDVLVIGKHNTIELNKKIAKLQKDFDREINIISLGSDEFKKRYKRDSLLRSIFKNPRRKLL